MFHHAMLPHLTKNTLTIINTDLLALYIFRPFFSLLKERMKLTRLNYLHKFPLCYQQQHRVHTERGTEESFVFVVFILRVCKYDDSKSQMYGDYRVRSLLCMEKYVINPYWFHDIQEINDNFWVIAGKFHIHFLNINNYRYMKITFYYQRQVL